MMTVRERLDRVMPTGKWAKLLGVTPAAVRHWKRQNRIPEWHVNTIEKMERMSEWKINTRIRRASKRADV